MTNQDRITSQPRDVRARAIALIVCLHRLSRAGIFMEADVKATHKRRDYLNEIGVSAILFAEIESAVVDVKYFQRLGYLDGLDVVVKKWPKTKSGYPKPLQYYYRSIHHLKELVAFFEDGWASRMLECLNMDSVINPSAMMYRLKYS